MRIKSSDLTGDAKAYVDATGAAELRTVARRNKYRNVRTRSFVTGHSYPSGGECRLAELLYVMEKDGEISELEEQKVVVLMGCITMRVDFRYVENGHLIHHEFKGVKTDRWRLQRDLWRLVGPTEYRVSYADQLWPAIEIIRPKPSDELIEIVLRFLGTKENSDGD